jgi:hypothetical protein
MRLFLCLTGSLFTYWFTGGTSTNPGTLVPMIPVTQVMVRPSMVYTGALPILIHAL